MINLNKKSSINYTKPIKTQKPRIIKQFSFFNIDSLHSITKNKIISGQIQSSQRLIVLDKNIKTNNDKIDLNLSFNPLFTIEIDTSNENIKEQIKTLEIKLNQINKRESKVLLDLKN